MHYEIIFFKRKKYLKLVLIDKHRIVHYENDILCDFFVEIIILILHRLWFSLINFHGLIHVHFGIVISYRCLQTIRVCNQT